MERHRGGEYDLLLWWGSVTYFKLLDTCSLVLNGPSWTSYRTSSDVTTASTSMDEFAGKYMKRGEILAPLG